MDNLSTLNSFEAAFWILIGLYVFWKGRSSVVGKIAAVWFILFGISDIWEAYSGSLWSPWPLPVFKALCIVVLITCGQIYRARLRQQRYE